MHARHTFFDRRRFGGARSTYIPTMWVIALLCSLVVSHDLYRTFEDKHRRVEEVQKHVSNLALASERQAGEAFSLINGSLVLLTNQIDADGMRSWQYGKLRKLMQEQVTNIHVLEGLYVVDASGEVLASFGPDDIGTSINKSDYFKYHQTHRTDRPYVNTLLHARATDDWVVVVSRRINHPDGAFGGIVIATFNMKYFQEFYSAINLGRDGVLALFRDDTTNLVRQPPLEGATGVPLTDPPPFIRPYTQASYGVFEGRSPVDGVQRISAWRWIPNFPLVVLVGLGANEQLAGWRLSATEHFFAALCMERCWALSDSISSIRCAD